MRRYSLEFRLNILRLRYGFKPIKIRGRTIVKLLADLEPGFLPEIEVEMIVKSRNPAKALRKFLTWQGIE